MKNKLVINALVFLGLLIAVHMVYIGVVRPNAELALDIARQQGLAAPVTWAIRLKDWEQEICIIMMFWGVYLMLWKSYEIWDQNYLFTEDLLESETQNENQTYLQTLYNLDPKHRDTSLVKTLIASLRRYEATRDVQNASSVINLCIESTAMKLEAGNSMILYFIWAIPSIGFIGTVRGISLALGEADKALSGDIAGMTENLGVAFNSTLIALLISVVLMALLHLLQNLQDGLVVNIEEYCDRYLVQRLSDHSAVSG